MSGERLPGGEHDMHVESEASHSHESHPKTHEANHGKTEQKTADIETISKEVEKHAKSQQETAVEEKPKHQVHPVIINQKLKSEALKTTLSRAQANLSPTERAFSKVVHQPAIDRVSEVGAKTVARPTSLLIAGFVALVGSSIALFMAHYYGFRYNLFLFFALLASGYLVGLIFEAIRTLSRGTKH